MLAYHLVPRRRNIASVNLKHCFPGHSNAQIKTLLEDHCKALGMGLIETAMAWWSSDHHIESLFSVTGLEHFEAAKAQGRGVLLLVPHSTVLELLGRMAAHVIGPYATMAGHQRDIAVDELIFRARSRHIDAVISAEKPLSAFRHLKAGKVLTIMPDHDHGPRHSVFALFFGVQAATLTATAQYACVNQSAVLMMRMARSYSKDGAWRYVLSFDPMLDQFPSDDAIADATRVNLEIERAVSVAPEQYWWAYRRFKTRPEGETNFYIDC